MQAQTDLPTDTATRGMTSGDIAVIISMAVVAGAVGMGSVLHGAWTPVAALMLGAAVWVALLPMHMLARIMKPAGAVVDQARTETSRTTVARDEQLPAPEAQPEPVAVAAAGSPSRLASRTPPKLPAQYTDAIADAVAAKDEAERGSDPAGEEDADGATSAATGIGRALPSTSPQIDDVIKRLATDILAGRRPVEGPAAGAAPAETISASSTAAPFPVRAEDFFSPPPLPAGANTGAKTDVAQPAIATPASSRVAAIADALLGEDIEVFLEPIQGLEDTGARHYEVSARLRLADGSSLDRDEYTEATRGTGLLPLIDAVKVSHTKRVALQLIERGRTGSFFSQVDGESLASDQFGEDVSAITSRDRGVTARLVLSFPQADVRGFTRAQWASLEELGALGFQFSVEHVTDMDMDFEDLGRRGFSFAKLDADVFVNGLPAPEGLIPPADICQHLARAGLTLIVQEISDERQLMEILGFGVLFGQGEMFGGARPVRAHVLRDAAPVYEGAESLA
ncbi:MAG: EAL domain-containing protein [Hyphomicrobiaceae bacterium]|nr:EAL domain-containing protein [Hyphomicrobiaceae bacterium]